MKESNTSSLSPSAIFNMFYFNRKAQTRYKPSLHNYNRYNIPGSLFRRANSRLELS